MITLTERSAGPITLRAPVGGTVRFRAPAALCGELEMFEAGDAVADVEHVEVCAPARGFILRSLAADGTLVERSMPLVVFKIA